MTAEMPAEGQVSLAPGLYTVKEMGAAMAARAQAREAEHGDLKRRVAELERKVALLLRAAVKNGDAAVSDVRELDGQPPFDLPQSLPAPPASPERDGG